MKAKLWVLLSAALVTATPYTRIVQATKAVGFSGQTVVKGTFAGVMLRDTGIGVVAPRTITGRFTTPLAGTVKKADSPDVVTPFCTHVARART